MACIGFMMAGWTAHRQALHDKLAGTLVVFRDVNPGASPPAARPPMPWYGWVVNLAGVGLLMWLCATIALMRSTYRDYTLRAQFVEGMLAGDEAKLAAGDFYVDKNRCPSSGAEAGFEAAGKTSSAIDYVAIEPGCRVVSYSPNPMP